MHDPSPDCPRNLNSFSPEQLFPCKATISTIVIIFDKYESYEEAKGLLGKDSNVANVIWEEGVIQ